VWCVCVCAVCVVCMQSNLMAVTVAGEWTGGGFLVVVQIRLVGHSLAEMRAAVCIVFEITN
jgi:hypothetical protein